MVLALLLSLAVPARSETGVAAVRDDLPVQVRLNQDNTFRHGDRAQVHARCFDPFFFDPFFCDPFFVDPFFFHRRVFFPPVFVSRPTVIVLGGRTGVERRRERMDRSAAPLSWDRRPRLEPRRPAQRIEERPGAARPWRARGFVAPRRRP